MIEEIKCFLGVDSCSAFTLNLFKRTDFLRGKYPPCICAEVSVEIVGCGKHNDGHCSTTKQLTNCLKVFMFLLFS